MNKKGIALLVALLIVSILFIGGGSIIWSSISELRMVGAVKNSMKAFYLAESGIQHGIAEIKADFDTYKIDGSGRILDENNNIVPTGIGENLGEGSYFADVQAPSYNEVDNSYTFLIVSTGTVMGIQRAIRQSVIARELESPEGYWHEAFDYAVYAASKKLSVKQYGSVIGDLFIDGDVSLAKYVEVDGTIYCTGMLSTGEGASPDESTYPDPMPPVPALDEDYYTDLVSGTLSDVWVDGSQELDTINLEGQSYFIDGNITITANGSINGPGTLAASGGIILEDGASIGSNMNIGCAGDIDIKGGATGADNTVFIAGNDIKVDSRESVMNKTALIALDNITIHHYPDSSGIAFNGLIMGQSVNFSDDTKYASLRGSIVSFDGFSVPKHINLIHDASSFPDTIPTGLGRVNRPEVVIEVIGSTWEEQ